MEGLTHLYLSVNIKHLVLDILISDFSFMNQNKSFFVFLSSSSCADRYRIIFDYSAFSGGVETEKKTVNKAGESNSQVPTFLICSWEHTVLLCQSGQSTWYQPH